MTDTSKYAVTFEIVDGDKDGQISADELRRLMMLLGTDVTEDQAAEMIDKMDSDGDGRVTLDEFAAFLASGPS